MPNPEGSQGKQWLAVTTRCSPRCSTTNPRPSPTVITVPLGFYRSDPHLCGKALALLFAFSAGTIHGCRCRTLSVLIVRVVVPAVGEGRRESVCENRRVSSSLRVSSLGDDSHEHGLKHQEQRGAGYLAHYRNPARLLANRFVRGFGSAGTRTRNQPRKLSGLLINRWTARLKSRARGFFFRFRVRSSCAASVIDASSFAATSSTSPAKPTCRVIVASLMLGEAALQILRRSRCNVVRAPRKM